jgi:hypothetical protein
VRGCADFGLVGQGLIDDDGDGHAAGKRVDLRAFTDDMIPSPPTFLLDIWLLRSELNEFRLSNTNLTR